MAELQLEQPGHHAAQGVSGDAVPAPHRSAWRALYHFNIYRLVLGVGLLTISVSGSFPADFGSRSQTLFLLCSLVLSSISLINMITINRAVPGFTIQASLHFTLDIVILTLLMFASGGVDSGIGLLMLVSVAASGVVLPGRLALGFAALATMAILGESIVSWILGLSPVGAMARVAMMGIALFATGLLLSMLSEKIHAAENLADRRAADLMALAQANAQIVSQLDMGTIMADAHDRVYFTNDKARALLGIEGSGVGALIKDLSPALGENLGAWRGGQPVPHDVVRFSDVGARIAPRFVVSDGDRDSVLVFLENLTLSEEKAQQIKLASLGRLTAAISHEIRNPLSAINHAGQLLQESPQIEQDDRRLLDIVLTQSRRINTIIQSVLQISRRSQVDQHQIELKSWSEAQAAEMAAQHGLPVEAIEVSGDTVDVNANSGHLQQVLTNLCDNAIRHSADTSDTPLVRLIVRALDDGSVQLDVADSGSGISSDDEIHLFEPFFTTHAEGTGLGLYICRELCAANGATLNYISDSEPGCTFRIEFEPARDSAPGM